MKIPTEEEIKEQLLKDDRWVERALVVLHNSQTEDEKRTKDTLHRNGKGFSNSDAPLGSYLAEWIKGGDHLTGRFLDMGRKMVLKYTRQLQEAAKEKALRKAA